MKWRCVIDIDMLMLCIFQFCVVLLWSDALFRGFCLEGLAGDCVDVVDVEVIVE